jgi:hypothetical protein
MALASTALICSVLNGVYLARRLRAPEALSAPQRVGREEPALDGVVQDDRKDWQAGSERSVLHDLSLARDELLDLEPVEARRRDGRGPEGRQKVLLEIARVAPDGGRAQGVKGGVELKGRLAHLSEQRGRRCGGGAR